ncbi:MAG: alpha/beta hydrolase-fold protein [Planctomycetota bacterium]
MASPLLPCVERELGDAPDRSVVWLHGLGADGHDFEPVLPYLGLPEGAPVRFVFPHAPAIPVTLNMGMVMPAWYDIVELDLRREADLDGVRRSAARIGDLLAREVARGSRPDRIVLAGFSQGGAVALYMALRWPERLAGCLALSTYRVGGEPDAAEAVANADLPVLQMHGTLDPMVAVERGRECRDALLATGRPVEWREFPMQHEVCLEELVVAGTWLRRVLGLD